jgi:5-oxoprolinase (ATP-hydrolysing) subunit A
VFFSNLDNIYSQHNDFLQYVSMGFVVDINCDMGESFGIYRIGNDEEVIKHITSSNIACGFHASDPVIMEKTIKLCKEHNVMAGAHPGYPDLIGFGRRLKKKWGL